MPQGGSTAAPVGRRHLDRIRGQHHSGRSYGLRYGRQAGLHIPNTAERTALKEGAAGIGAGLGTSISFARSAGQQVAMDVVRGVMSGGSQYLASKMREAKVSVKAGYGVLLISEQ